MARFVYHYLDAGGRRRLAWQQADDAASCCTLLADRGIYPIFLLGLRLPAFFAASRLSARQLALFFQQLSLALLSGVPLLTALHDMAGEADGARQRAFIARLEEGVLSGLAFSQALQRERAVAPMLSQWIAIGEKQGRLAEILAEVHGYLEERERLKKRVQQQLLYPLMVLAGVLLVGVFICVVVIPALAYQFMDFEGKLPLFMRGCLLLHDVLLEKGWLVLLLVVAMVAAPRLLRHSAQQPWRSCCKRWLMQLPVLRQFALLQVYVPFARLFGQLLHSGVSVGEAMQELQRYFQRSLFADDVAAIAETMRHGGRLSQALADASFVPGLACQMLRNGERYGRLPQALLDSARYYETVLMEKMGLWIRFVEPLAIVLLGLLVLMMALGLFVPVLESYQSLLAQ